MVVSFLPPKSNLPLKRTQRGRRKKRSCSGHDEKAQKDSVLHISKFEVKSSILSTPEPNPDLTWDKERDA